MDMGDMDMGSDPGIGVARNHALARGYWYSIVGVTVVLMAIRGLNAYDARQRQVQHQFSHLLKACHDTSIPHPTRPRGPLTQAWATATALVREASHPQLYIPIKGLRWATPPPLGRVLLLGAYCSVVAALMSYRAVVHDVYYYERIGYRNAWVAAAQLPLLFLLSMKANPLGFLVGVGHERLNWLHRWVARVLFVTATVHGWHFWTMWVKADFVSFELEIMPLVKYGIGAWGVMLWTLVVGFAPVRRLAYEVWVVQHVVSYVLILWLVHKHIPDNTARYLVWMSVSFLVVDRAARWFILLWRNIKLHPRGCMRHVGHTVSTRAVCSSTTVVTIKDVRFSWRPGQHIYLWIPRLGALEAHPYTIASADRTTGECCCDSVQVVVRAHAGFSRRLRSFAQRRPDAELAGFVSGPYGAPPRWDVYETAVLVGASTGASFVLPILESVASEESCTKRIEVVLVARTGEELAYYVERAEEAGRRARGRGVTVRIHVAVTGGKGGQGEAVIRGSSSEGEEAEGIEGSKRNVERSMEKGACCCTGAVEKVSPLESSSSSCHCNTSPSGSPPELTRSYTQRPDMDALIREPVEQAWGETAVVVCGGPELVAQTRNTVSRLSDERAVHKGTGAQGIFLHVEEYSF